MMSGPVPFQTARFWDVLRCPFVMLVVFAVILDVEVDVQRDAIVRTDAVWTGDGKLMCFVTSRICRDGWRIET